MRYAYIKMSTGVVKNTIEYDPNGNFVVPDGYEVVRSDTASIGMVYANGEFSWPSGHGAETTDAGNGNPPKKPPGT